MHEELIWQCYTQNELESIQLVNNRIKSLPVPFVIYLEGQLGAGKTFFCQQIAKNKRRRAILTSSSFLNLNIYLGKHKIIHVDYYYNNEPNEFFYKNIFEEMDDNTILLSEWSPEYFDLGITQFILKIVVESDMRKISFYSL